MEPDFEVPPGSIPQSVEELTHWLHSPKAQATTDELEDWSLYLLTESETDGLEGYEDDVASTAIGLVAAGMLMFRLKHGLAQLH